MLTVVARIVAKPGQEEATKKALLKLVPITVKEKGCIEYVLHQSNDDARLFLFHENWTDRAALDAHLQAPHVKAFHVQAETLLAQPPELTFLTKIS